MTDHHNCLDLSNYLSVIEPTFGVLSLLWRGKPQPNYSRNVFVIYEFTIIVLFEGTNAHSSSTFNWRAPFDVSLLTVMASNDLGFEKTQNLASTSPPLVQSFVMARMFAACCLRLLVFRLNEVCPYSGRHRYCLGSLFDVVLMHDQLITIPPRHLIDIWRFDGSPRRDRDNHYHRQ